jgi:hypothetical protein
MHKAHSSAASLAITSVAERFRCNRIAPEYVGFRMFRGIRLGGPKYSGSMAEPVPDARSCNDRRILPFEGIWRS